MVVEKTGNAWLNLEENIAKVRSVREIVIGQNLRQVKMPSEMVSR